MAIINLSKDNIGNDNFPENKIILLNGSELECYPKAIQPDEQHSEEMKLDNSGEFLCIGKRRVSLHAVKVEKKKDLTDEIFFLDNAFFFYNNADKILKDSRMFLAPIPIQSGIAYTGTSGFGSPTLGVYLEWWLYSESNNTKDKDGNDALTYHIAGSPLSGSNSCSCVYPDGTSKSISHRPFGPVWQDFIRINSRYSDAKHRYESYSLQQVWEILLSSEQSEESMLSTKILIQEGQISILKNKLTGLNGMYNALIQKFHNVCIKLHYRELDEFTDEYHRRELETKKQLEELDRQKKEYRTQMKQKAIDNVTYQKLIHPITKKRKELLLRLSSYKYDQINILTKDGDITYGMIMDFLNSKK